MLFTKFPRMDYETPDMLVRVQDHVTIVRLRAANLASTNDIGRLSSALEHLLSEGARRLVIDFKLVRHVGSSALGMLLAIQMKVKAVGGRLVISHPEHLRELLHVSKTAKLFELAEDSKAALAMLKPASPI
jgi:anti-anti-sigma factor